MVTLVIPIYNVEDYLPRCVASIQAQTCRDFEVVLVDDGSTDSSGVLCDGYAARGEWVVFPDPDDWIEPDYVEMFLHFQRQYQADLVCLG